VYYGKNYELYEEYANKPIDVNNQYLTIILKVLLITILLGVIYFGYIYISNIKNRNNFSTNPMPIQPQCVKEVTSDDIAKIVSLVVERINTKSNRLSDDQYSKELSRYTIKDNNRVLKELNIYTQAKTINTQLNTTQDELSDNNNRVTIESNKKIFSNIPLEIDSNKKDNYTKNIEKELKTRESEMRVIVVKRGDSLSKIAKRAYGDSKYYYKIIKANPKLQKNPNLIYVGQKLRIP